jgi:hypothetical protein
MVKVIDLICKYITDQQKVNIYDESNFNDTYIKTNVKNRIKNMDYLGGPSTLYIFQKDNKKIILFGDIHIYTKNLICNNDSKNIIYITDYLRYLFENTNKIYDIYNEFDYSKNKIDIGGDNGMLSQVQNKFQDCIENIMDRSKCKYNNNVRFHNVDIRFNILIGHDIFYKVTYIDSLYLLYTEFQDYLFKSKQELTKILDTVKNMIFPQKEFVIQKLEDFIAYPKYILTDYIDKATEINISYYKDLERFINDFNDLGLDYPDQIKESMDIILDFYNGNIELKNHIIDKNKIQSEYKNFIYKSKLLQNYSKLDKDIKDILSKYIDYRINKLFSYNYNEFNTLLSEINNKTLYFSNNKKDPNGIYFIDIYNKYYQTIFHYGFFSNVLAFDIYLILRMFKKFDILKGIIKKEYAENIFVITGNEHTKEVANFLENYLKFNKSIYIESEFYKQRETYPDKIPLDIIKYKCIKVNDNLRKLLLE